MVSVAPQWLSPDLATTAAMTVLVADPDAESLLAISEELTGRGFLVLPVTTWSAAAATLAAHEVHIGVVHSSVADVSALVGRAAAVPPSVDRSSQVKETPFVFTVGDARSFDWDSYGLLDCADYVVGPVLVGDLGHRVSSLARRLQRRTEAGIRADELRTAVKRVSDAIQRTNQPAAIADLLVRGVADVFRAGDVCFTTFTDERVAHLAVRSHSSRAETSGLTVGRHQPGVLRLATRLWGVGEAIEWDRYRQAGGYPELSGWSPNGGPVSMAVPLGSGGTPFGLLWMSTLDHLREWSPIEVALLRHLTGIAAQALMQGRIITGQQEVLERLRRLDDAKSNFLRTVNHELRTPLTSLTAYLDLVREGAGGEVPLSALNMLGVVERNARRLQLLVDDVLTISRMTANPEVDWKPVNISQLLSSVAQGLREAAGARRVEVDVTDTATDLVVEGDPARLRQVFRNIADNAIKFTPAGGRVAVSARRCVLAEGVAAVDVAIADTGDGIPDQDKPELFTAFFRGSNAEADAVTGSGLGLAIVRGVVDAHGGAIVITETAGGGTTLSVQLPVQRRAGG